MHGVVHRCGLPAILETATELFITGFQNLKRSLVNCEVLKWSGLAHDKIQPILDHWVTPQRTPQCCRSLIVLAKGPILRYFNINKTTIGQLWSNRATCRISFQNQDFPRIPVASQPTSQCCSRLTVLPKGPIFRYFNIKLKRRLVNCVVIDEPR